MVSWGTVLQVVESIVAKFRPRKIVVFGSYARGDASPDSDLDILVITECDEPTYQRAAAIRLEIHPSPCPIDILVYTPEEIERYEGVTNHIVTEALREGIVAYEDDGR